MVTIYIKYVFMKYLSQKDNFHKNIHLSKMVKIFILLQSKCCCKCMKIQQQVKIDKLRMLQKTTKRDLKKITKCFICCKGNISLKTLRYFAKKKNIPFFKFLNIIYSGVNETNYMLCINFSKPVRASTEKIPGVLKHTLLSVTTDFEHFMIVRKSKETELSSYITLNRSGHFKVLVIKIGYVAS